SELILVELLRLAPEVIAPQLAQHVEQTLVLGRHSITFGDGGIALASDLPLLALLGAQHRLEALDVVRESVGRIRHAHSMGEAWRVVSGPFCRESTCHQDHCVACGARTRRICTRDQSSPSKRAES